MKKKFGLLGVLLAAFFLLSGLKAEAYYDRGEVDWNTQKVVARGEGVAPANTYGAQARILARRAAVVDAYRNLAELVQGVDVDAETTVEQAMISSDVIKTKVNALIKGAQVVSEEVTADGGYIVTVEMPIFGARGLSSAVIERPTYVEPFPTPEPIIPATPSAPQITITIKGGYTGVIIDCRGFNVKPVMSPVIKDSRGTKVYGHKNLDPDYVIEYGMASYANSMSQASRAGSNPLIIKAERLEDFNANPVISQYDANHMLMENESDGFLEKAAVVFLY